MPKGSFVVGALLLVGVVAIAEQGHEAPPDHRVITAESLEWGPPPPGLPVGAQVALLSGDPGSAGPYTLRAQLPAGYVVPPHWHATAEHLTVLSGTMRAGHGETMDDARSSVMEAGDFVVMPAEMRHWIRCEEEVLLQIHGNGPFSITYVDSANDPRQAPASEE